MKECYLTGSTGFVGKHLTEQLSEFVAIPHSEIDTIELEPYKRFFFLSSYGNIAGQDEIDKIIKANTLDLIKILNQSDFQDGVISFVYFSSSSVTRKIQTAYSRAKRASEEILLSYMEKFNAPICVIRPYSITGVGEQKEHLIPTLIRSCIDGERMPFVPEPTHDFIDIDDVVSGTLKLSKMHTKGIFELGTGNSLSNLEVKQIVEKITGKKANTYEVKHMRSYDGDDWVCKNFNARNYGWIPKKSIFDTIEEMVNDYVRKKDN